MFLYVSSEDSPKIQHLTPSQPFQKNSDYLIFQLDHLDENLALELLQYYRSKTLSFVAILEQQIELNILPKQSFLICSKTRNLTSLNINVVSLGLLPHSNGLIELYKFVEETNVVLGRDEECSTINTFLNEAEKTRRICLISGEAGIGKSEILKATTSDEINIQRFSILNKNNSSWWTDQTSQQSARLQSPEEIAKEINNQINENHISLCIIEDIHWCNSISERILNSLLKGSLTNTKFILTSRVNYSESIFSDIKRTEILPLPLLPLNKKGTSLILQYFIGKQNSSSFLESVHHLAGGNPLFIKHIASLIKESASISKQADHFEGVKHQASFLERFSSVTQQLLHETPEDQKILLKLLSLSNKPVPIHLIRQKNELITKQLADHLFLDSKDNEIIFKHDIIRLSLDHSLPRPSEEAIEDFIKSLIEYKQYRTAVDLQLKLKYFTKDFFEHCYESTHSSVEKNDLDGILFYTDQGLNYSDQKQPEKHHLLYLYQGLGLATLGRIEDSYKPLGLALKHFKIHTNTLQSFLFLSRISPNKKINSKPSFISKSTLDPLLIDALRHRIEFAWISRQAADCLSSCISYYKFGVPKHNKYFGEPELLIGMAIYSSVSKKWGSSIIEKITKTLKSESSEKLHYAQFLQIHHQLGGEHWLEQKERATALLNSVSSSQSSLIGKVSLDVFIIDYFAADYDRAMKTVTTYLTLMKSYKNSWLSNVLQLTKSFIHFSNNELDHVIYNLDQIDSKHVSNDPAYHFCLAISHLNNNYDKSLLHFNKGISMLTKERFKEFSRSIFIMEAIILSLIHNKKNRNTFEIHQPITKHIKTNSKKFNSYLPGISFLKFIKEYYKNNTNNTNKYKLLLEKTQHSHHLQYFLIFQDFIILNKLTSNHGSPGQQYLIKQLKRV